MGLKLASLVFGYGLTFLAGAVNKIIIVFKALRVAISFLNAATRGFFWPIALITTAYAVYKNWNAVKALFLKIWEPIKPYWNEFIDLMDELGVTDIITDAWDAAADFFQDIWDDVTIKWDAFIELMEELGVTQFIIDAWEGLKKTFNTLWDAAKPYWESFIDLINRINVADVLITAWEGLKTTFETLWNVATP
jgi:phage-related protein